LSSLRGILEAAADQIRETMVAEADWDIQVEPTMILNPSPPAIDLYWAGWSSPVSGSFADTYAQMGEGYPVNVRARVAPNDNVANQDVLVDLLDPDNDISLVQALYDDTTLGGVASDVTLESVTEYVLVPKVDGSAVHLGVIWRFLMIPARS
jgi:hypothetical protein